MLTHEVYCSLDTCKLLKEAGFDWECKLYFSELINAPKEAGIFDDSTNKVYGVFDSTIPDIGNPTEDDILRPTLEVAQRYLREVKNIEAVPWRWPTKVLFVNGYKPWSYKLVEYRDLKGVDIEDFDASGEDYFKSYEEAQESGIKKALEIILEK